MRRLLPAELIRWVWIVPVVVVVAAVCVGLMVFMRIAGVDDDGFLGT